MNNNRARVVATLAVALLLTACSGGNQGTPTSPSTPTQTSTASSSSPSSSSPSSSSVSLEERAAQQAEAVYRDYLRAQTRCLSEPLKTLPTCFDDVAIGDELNTRRQALRAAQEVGSKVSGDISIISIRTTKVDLTNKVTERPPTVPEVVFAVCLDVSKFNIVDKDGKSIVPPSRMPHVPVNVSVLNYKLPDPSQWRVGLVTDVKDGSC